VDRHRNHSTAYHAWIAGIAAAHHGSVLDVGCGDGLLIERLAPMSTSVVGIDIDGPTLARARLRLQGQSNVTFAHEDFLCFVPSDEQFDTIAFVASLHHMDMKAALTKARSLLKAGGDLLVADGTAQKRPPDWVANCQRPLPARLGGIRHRETRESGVPTLAPSMSLDEVRQAVGQVLPGAAIRRRPCHRYLLRWTRPGRG
jgi:SAM-dependent methyltransferase